MLLLVALCAASELDDETKVLFGLSDDIQRHEHDHAVHVMEKLSSLIGEDNDMDDRHGDTSAMKTTTVVPTMPPKSEAELAAEDLKKRQQEAVAQAKREEELDEAEDMRNERKEMERQAKLERRAAEKEETAAHARDDVAKYVAKSLATKKKANLLAEFAHRLMRHHEEKSSISKHAFVPAVDPVSFGDGDEVPQG